MESIASVNRDGQTTFPRATTRIEAGDDIMVMADMDSDKALRAFLEGPGATVLSEASA